VQELAQKAAALTRIDAREIFATLLAARALGSTASAAALHPARAIGGAQENRQRVRAAGRADRLQALDNEPVDLISCLLAPEHAGATTQGAGAHIAAAAEPSTIERLRASKDAPRLYSVLPSRRARC